MILVDSSAWIEFDRATGSTTDRRLSQLIGQGGAIAVTEPVLMEVTAGARSDDAAARFRDHLVGYRWLGVDAAADFDAAARVYRRCRRAGVTPRGLIDCLIVAVAWRSGAALLACDVDIERIAEVMGVAVDRIEPDTADT